MIIEIVIFSISNHSFHFSPTTPLEDESSDQTDDSSSTEDDSPGMAGLDSDTPGSSEEETDEDLPSFTIPTICVEGEEEEEDGPPCAWGRKDSDITGDISMDNDQSSESETPPEDDKDRDQDQEEDPEERKPTFTVLRRKSKSAEGKRYVSVFRS